MKNLFDQRYRHQPAQHDRRVRPIAQDRPLTDQQALVLRIITEAIEQHGEPPSGVTIGRRLKITNNAALTVITALQRKGYLRMIGSQTKTIKLTGKI